MRYDMKHQEEKKQEAYTTTYTNHFGAVAFEEDSLEKALNDHFQKA